MELDDAQLIEQTLAGRSESFGLLIRRYQGAVQGLAYHLAGGFDDAQDIAQEAFVAAYLELRQLRRPERFPAWLRQLTLNCGRMWLRQRREHAPFDESTSASPMPSPSEEFERTEIHRRLHRALTGLGDDHRLAVTLHYLGSLSYAQIASFLDVPLSTIEGRMHRARKKLKGSLLTMVEERMREESLSPEFARQALEEALKRAEEARQRWEKQAFVHSCRQAMEAASRLEDAQKQIDVFTMLGQASSTWMGEEEKAVQHYESALEIARAHGDQTEIARILKEIAAAHCRHGRFQQMREPAREAIELFTRLADGENQALMAAALDLAEELPEKWTPGQKGGYVMAAFPVEVGDAGHRFLDPQSMRNYSWGCPSRCTALVHLLRPRRFLGPDLAAGATWEDRIVEQPDGLSWGIKEGDELIARSTVERADDLIATPAGKFPDCLRVKTDIEPVSGGRATEFFTRSYCGTRIAWYAPGVGLVKLRHVDQNDQSRNICLLEYQGEATSGYFPLNPGQSWRYRSLEKNLTSKELFEDICKVVHTDGDLIYLSSATLGVEQADDELLACFKEILMLEEETGDLEGMHRALDELTSRLGEQEKTETLSRYENLRRRAREAHHLQVETKTLWSIAQRLDDGEKERKSACYERLIGIGETLGDEFLRHSAAWSLRETREGISPELQLQWFEEAYTLASKLDNQNELLNAILSLAYQHRHQERFTETARWFEEAAAVVRKQGDISRATGYISDAELAREMDSHPPGFHIAYLRGDADLIQKEDGSLEEGNSARSWVDGNPFPPGPAGTPIHDFLHHVPFNGISLLSAEIGTTSSDGLNTKLAGQSQHIRLNSTLQSRSETVAAPTGRFTDCILIETQVSTSEEDHQLGPELEQIRAYYAGVKKIWYAPGVGLVRLLYQHCNGRNTDIQLVGCKIKEASDDYLPLALDNRWRYRWVDSESETLYEDSLRVAAHDTQKWHISFVTRATARRVS